MIEREVTRHEVPSWSGERRRAQSVRRRRSSALHQYSQRVCALFDVNSQIPNRPRESTSVLLPMKHLAGIKRLLEIKIGRTNFREFHKWIALSSARCNPVILASFCGEPDPPLAVTTGTGISSFVLRLFRPSTFGFRYSNNIRSPGIEHEPEQEHEHEEIGHNLCDSVSIRG